MTKLISPAYYNCRHDGDQYRITKFDPDLNVESTYLCTTDACECPAGQRPTCRHREMLPKFILKDGAIGGNVFYEIASGQWFANDQYDDLPADDPEPLPQEPTASAEFGSATIPNPNLGNQPEPPQSPPSKLSDRRM